MTAAAVETQTHLVEVEFKGNRRAFYRFTGEAPPPPRTAVIVQVERGEDLGRIHATGALATKRKAGTTHGKAAPDELPRVVRLARPEEVDRAVRLRADEHAVRKAAIEFARELKLDLKISDTEWQWDRRKLTCFFTAEERVDFRELVRRLERRFSTRVHMWHIGVRDEARRLDGIGRCGRQFCSSSWLPELRPVKSSTAKDQRLSTLNPAQISGTCGRLMCCLRHEHEFYVQARKRFPKEGKILTTAVGEEKVVSNDIFRDQVTLRTAEGEHRTIPLAQLRSETAPGAVPPEDAGLATADLVRIGRADADGHEESDHDDADQIADDELTDDELTDDGADGAASAAPHDGRPQPHATTDSPPRDTGPRPVPEQGERRRRRRRGRRGGRRGRGDAEPGGNEGAADAPPE